jgi:hypothetical protein
MLNAAGWCCSLPAGIGAVVGSTDFIVLYCRAYTAVGVLTIIALAISSFNNTLAFYWVLFVLALQRGPVLPCQEELSEPTDARTKNIALALYALPLLVLLPYPVELLLALQNLPDPIPF